MAASAHGRILRGKEAGLVRAASNPTTLMMKENVMAKREPAEYRALVSDEGGIIRGRIPSPLVKAVGARAGDYLVFRLSDSGDCAVSVARGKGTAKKSGKAKKSTKKSAGKSGKRR
jgi:hypothetical protein